MNDAGGGAGDQGCDRLGRRKESIHAEKKKRGASDLWRNVANTEPSPSGRDNPVDLPVSFTACPGSNDATDSFGVVWNDDAVVLCDHKAMICDELEDGRPRSVCACISRRCVAHWYALSTLGMEEYAEETHLSELLHGREGKTLLSESRK